MVVQTSLVLRALRACLRALRRPLQVPLVFLALPELWVQLGVVIVVFDLY